MDNTAIERIATTDLTDDVLELLETYQGNDEVIFFLGRVVWQGKMVKCAAALFNIAIDSSRGRYARIAAIRGVMSISDTDQKYKLLEAIADNPSPIDRAVFAELLDWAPPTTKSITLLFRSLEHTAPYKQFNGTGLRQSLHDFIDRLPIMADSAEDHPLGSVVDGLNLFIGREPFVEQGKCQVSQEFEWLMSAALHAVDRLVAARSSQALMPNAIAILRNMPALRFWRSGDVEDYKTSLDQNVPRWPELNDLLYWNSIAACRAQMATKEEPLLDDWQMAYLGHFWEFGPADFKRCLEWVKTKNGDDRSIALSRCLRLYVEADRPSAWLDQLHAAVADNKELISNLEARLDSKPSQAMEAMEAKQLEWKRKNDARNRKEKQDRADWVREIKADPDRVLHPLGQKPGEMSNDQYYLLHSIISSGDSTSQDDFAKWRTLIPEFGESVARAFRDAAIAHWRTYLPTLRSEGGGNTGATPYSLIFAMAGLAIEAGEDRAFPQQLSKEEARLAFRYITWELNGFPRWFETLFHAFPEIGRDAVMTELSWELEHIVAEQPLHYILHDILYYAHWLHSDVAPFIHEWLRTHEMHDVTALNYCLNILTGGSIKAENLATLAAEKSKGTMLVEQRPRWFALWVDTDPSAAIPALMATLEKLPPSDASAFAQQFIVGLLGDRHGTGTRTGAYRNARDLKMLYILMHRYILVADDIDRSGKGVYSPTLRDNAQDARSTLFNMLNEVPGADAYEAMKELEEEHPEIDYRQRMAVRARQRAIQDADEPLWTIEQVRDFSH